MPSRIFAPCFAVAIAFIGNVFCVADEWPDWMGPQRDGVWREDGIVRKIPSSGLKEVWRKPIGIGYTGPSVQGEHVYVMDWQPAPREDEDEQRPARPQAGIPGTERVLCLSMKSGETVWEHAYDCTYRISYPNGPRATPIVDGEHVYTLGAMGRLICLRRETGAVVWQKELTESYETKPPFWGYASHPLIAGERLFCTVGGADSAIVCFDKSDGTEIWKSRTSSDVGYVPLVMFQAEGRIRQEIGAGSIIELASGRGRFSQPRYRGEQLVCQISGRATARAGHVHCHASNCRQPRFCV